VARPVAARGLALLAVVVLAWGLTWPVNKVILASLTPIWAVAIRSVIGALALFALSLALGRLRVPPRSDVPVVLSLALLHMVGFGVLASVGLALVPTGRSVLLAYTTPLWVMPGAALFLGERLTARRAIGVLVGLAGLAVLFNPLAFDWRSRDALIGNGAALASALSWAASILHLRGHRWRSTPFDLLPWQSALAAVVVSAIALGVDGVPAVAWHGTLVAMLLYAGIPGTALAYWAMAMAGKTLPAVTTSLGLLVTPVVSVIVATLWLRESLTGTLIAAIALILGGVALGIDRDGGLRAPPKPPIGGSGRPGEAGAALGQTTQP
jgi:drug/metabolite transporter (DMT)-like permease